MKRIFYLLSILLLISCGNSKNSPEFMSSVEGRYLFNSIESIEVYFKDDILKVKWRGLDVAPLKVSDSSFYLKEMNEKLVFISKPEMHIELAPKREHDGEKFNFSKLKKGEKTPKEYFENKEYEKALTGYLAIQQKDSLDATIRWNEINNSAHHYFENDKKEEAFELFKINIKLYPKKPSVYRNYGYVLLRVKDTANAIINYRKALDINPDDYRALSFFERIKKK
jgi:tetratricopeptide (TPR) repeat protein